MITTFPMQEQDAPQPDDHQNILSAKSEQEYPDWTSLVERIQANDEGAVAELYAVFGKGLRYLMLRNLGQEDVEDKVHDCFVIVMQALRNGELRDPSRLMGYIRTVVRRQIAAGIEQRMSQRKTRVDYQDSSIYLSDWDDNPESAMVESQRAEIANKVLNGISRRDREILRRFYVHEQSMAQICEEMQLSYNQFRLLKSRAKARFGELGRRMAGSTGILEGKK